MTFTKANGAIDVYTITKDFEKHGIEVVRAWNCISEEDRLCLGCQGYVRKGKRYVFFNADLRQVCYMNGDMTKWFAGFRPVKDSHDFVGGAGQFTEYDNFVEGIAKFFDDKRYVTSDGTWAKSVLK